MEINKNALYELSIADLYALKKQLTEIAYDGENATQEATVLLKKEVIKEISTRLRNLIIT